MNRVAMALDDTLVARASAMAAAAEREAGPRRLAAVRACFDNARPDTAERPSRFRAFVTARARFADFFLGRPWPAL